MMEPTDLEKKYQGEWILLFNDIIIDHSSNIEEILKIAEEKFPDYQNSSDAIKIAKIHDGKKR